MSKNERFAIQSLRQTITDSWKHGLWIQLGNLAQLLNYRVGYYLLGKLTHDPVVALALIGVFSAAIQIAESLWLLARSVATVQYSRIANLKSRTEALAFSIRLIKFNYSFTALGCLVLILLPTDFYTSLLGEEFAAVRNLTLLLIPGIVFLSISNGVSHYFAGIGDNRYNAQSSLFGLIISVGLGYGAIFYFSVHGAAFAASLTYVLQTVYQLMLLIRKDRVRLGDLLVNGDDFLEFKEKIKNVLIPRN